MNQYILDVQGVGKRFGGLQALRDVNLQVEDGTIHAIIGPNGAGKSTLLNVLIGLLDADEGTVLFTGKTVVGLRPFDQKFIKGQKPHTIMQRGIARVFQTPQIFPAMSLLENVAISALAKRDGQFAVAMTEALEPDHPMVRNAAHYLKRLGLGDMLDARAEHLSRGDKRRLELAACLASQPLLLLLDEPTAGMSRHDTNKTIDLLREISGTGMTMLVIEHDMHVVFSLADTISVLAQGHIIASGAPEDVRKDRKVKEAYLGGAVQ